MQCDTTQSLLDKFHSLNNKTASTCAELALNLHSIRLDLGEDHWKTLMLPTCRKHEVFEFFIKDPYTNRAWTKPSGYAGDAVMLDYIHCPPSFLELEPAIYEAFLFTTTSDPAKAVVWRRDYFANVIQDMSINRAETNVLAFACGHFREAISGKLDCANPRLKVVAIDQDEDCITVLRNDYKFHSIDSRKGSLSEFLKGRFDGEKYDLTYAAGLYDYLASGIAKTLTRKFFDSLTPNGIVVVTNFLSKHCWRSYMEAFMDWNLALRNESEIRSLASEIPLNMISNINYFEDPYGCVGYLVVNKRDV